MEFRTKREAEERIEALERDAADAWADIVEAILDRDRAEAVRKRATERMLLNEAARIRALLPTLPE
jgi:hypothetical protein